MPENAKHSNVKVVRLEPESQRMARARIARLPAPVHAVHEKGKHLLMEKLKGFFDRADDSLFALADKAGSNQEQNIYFDSMREVRVQRRGFEKRFAMAIDAAFAGLATGDVPTVSTVEESVSSEGLSLVQNDELEELVAVESSVNRASNEFAELLQQISMRLDSQVPVKVFHKNNPLGPEVIANGFVEQARRLDIDIKAKLVLFKLFDKAIMQNLEDLYQAVNQTLIDHKILPSLSLRSGASGAKSHSAHAAPQVSQPPVQPETAAQDNASSEVARLLSGMLSEQKHAQVQQAGVSDVVNMLSLAQQAPEPAGFQGNIKALDLINDLQRRTGSANSLGRTETEVIKLVDMLFKFILEDRNLAGEMKAQISRMLLPLVKVALLDKSFFAKGGHSARRLLNEVATAALGWQPAAEGQADPLYNKVNDTVTSLLNGFDTDVTIFNDLLADFSSFIEKDRRRSEVMERRTLDAEDGKAKAEVSRTIVAIEVELRTIDQNIPQTIKKLIDGPWSNVLFINNLKHGSESREWLEALQILEDLVWSVKVPENNEQRKTLIRLVPDLLQRLRSGLDSISFNPFEMSEIFKDLEDIHLSCIRGKVAEQPRKEPVSTPAKATEAVNVQAPGVDDGEEGEVADELDDVELTEAEDELFADIDAVLAEASGDQAAEAEIAEEPSRPNTAERLEPVAQAKTSQTEVLGASDNYMQQAASFVQGAWFEMTEDDGGVSRCRLAAVIKPTGKYIFVNRSGMKVAERNQQELALLLKANRLRALDNSMLFDRALETVVSSLRKPQP